MELERPSDSAEVLPQAVYDEYIRSSEHLTKVQEIVQLLNDGETLENISQELLDDINWDEIDNPDTEIKPVLGADYCSVMYSHQYMDRLGVHTSSVHLYEHDGEDYVDFDITPPAEHTYSMYATLPRKADDLSQPNSKGLHVLYVPMPGVDTMLQKPFIVNFDVYNRVGVSAKHVAYTYDEQHHAAAEMMIYNGLATFISPEELSKISEIKRTGANVMLHDALKYSTHR